MFRLYGQQTGVEYIRTILYYMSDATEKVTRAELEQVVRQQGREGERVMTTIAQEYIQEGIQLGLEQGLKQGIENLQNSILDLLAIRLGEVNEEVAERLTAVTDMPRLRQLLREAATAVTMTAFAERLDELTQED
jgi:flagellar biosynthesis/type III secretory pathway protein FliH